MFLGDGRSDLVEGRGFLRADTDGNHAKRFPPSFVRLETNYRTKRFENSPSTNYFCGKSSRKNHSQNNFSSICHSGLVDACVCARGKLKAVLCVRARRSQSHWPSHRVDSSVPVRPSVVRPRSSLSFPSCLYVCSLYVASFSLFEKNGLRYHLVKARQGKPCVSLALPTNATTTSPPCTTTQNFSCGFVPSHVSHMKRSSHVVSPHVGIARACQRSRRWAVIIRPAQCRRGGRASLGSTRSSQVARERRLRSARALRRILLFRHLIACRPPEVTKGEQRGFLLLPQCASCRSVSWETRLAHPAAQAKAGPRQRETVQLQRPITSRHHRGTVGAWSNRTCL